MKRRKLPPPPEPAADNGQAVQAAKAIAAAINQGLPGGQFANLMNVMNGASVKLAASLTVPEVIAWFQENEQAAAILKACPTFDLFAATFHQRARELYPQATPPAATA